MKRKVITNVESVSYNNQLNIQELRKKIKKLDKIYEKVEEDLANRYYKTVEFLQSQSNIYDYEIDSTIEVYDNVNEEKIETFYYYSGIFKNKNKYDIRQLLNCKEPLLVSDLMYHLFSIYGFYILEQKFIFWSNVNSSNQKRININKTI